MIVWGGGSYAGGPTTYLDTGARYDPRTDTWTPVTTTGAAGARLGHKAVWTGDQIILWGGVGATGYVATGGRYSPAQDAWISMATPAALSGRELHSAVWTGREMIIWGGTASSYENTGGRYSLDINNWTSTTLTGAPDGRHSHSAVWTGSRMLVWGGTTNTGPTTNTGGAYGGDDSPPIAGVIRDGNNPPDLILQLDRTSISANWSGFSDPESGIVRYEWAIGTSPGATDVMPFRDTGTIGGTVYGLSLSVGTTYYVTARFTNGDRRTTTASSNGVYIGNDLTASSGCSASVSGAGMLPLGTGLVALILLLAAKRRVRE
jgi:hypothetical protein